MNARIDRAIARLARAATELASPTKGLIHVFLKDSPPLYERYVAKLQSSVERLRALVIQHYLLTPQHAAEGAKTAHLRKRLRREYMIPLTRTAKPLLRFASGIDKTLKVPHARASHRELVATAEVMLEAVQPYRKLLISAGLPRAFLTEFRGLTKELKRIATTSSERQAKFARVDAALREEVATGNEALSILDGFFLARADKDPRFAKTWKEIMRTPKRMGRPRVKKGQPEPNELFAHGSREEPLNI